MSDDERDFLTEAQQAKEMASAMAQIAALTSSATMSLTSLNTTQFDDALTFEPAPISSYSSSSSSYSSSASSSASSSSASSSSSSSSADAHEYEYPDMSRYYSGTDYASSLPAVSGTPAPSYSSGFTSLFAPKAWGESSGGGGDDDDDGRGGDHSKYDRRIDARDSPRSPFLRRCYQLLAVAFVALLLADLFENQQLPDMLSLASGASYTFEGFGNGTASGAGLMTSGRSSSGSPREALQKLMLFGRHGASPGRFDQPKGLLLVRNRFLFVSDFANKRLQMLHFHDDAAVIKRAPGERGETPPGAGGNAGGGGGAGSAGGEGGLALEPVFEYALEMDQVGGPWALAALDDYIFVAEWGMHRVKILKLDSKTGQLKAEGFFGQ